jgi:hypothetical protein
LARFFFSLSLSLWQFFNYLFPFWHELDVSRKTKQKKN